MTCLLKYSITADLRRKSANMEGYSFLDKFLREEINKFETCKR
jgi:hypothetical protein